MIPTPSELKQTLLSEGFEIYRTRGSDVILADRVRDNLILDSGVSAQPGEKLKVRFIARAQAADFTGESPIELFDRARLWVGSAVERGYQEVSTAAVAIRDPGDPGRTLDTWYEIAFEKPVASPDELISELRYALSLNKTVSPEARNCPQ